MPVGVLLAASLDERFRETDIIVGSLPKKSEELLFAAAMKSGFS